MMEHDDKVCPHCGALEHDHGYSPSPSLNVGSAPEIAWREHDDDRVTNAFAPEVQDAAPAAEFAPEVQDAAPAAEFAPEPQDAAPAAEPHVADSNGLKTIDFSTWPMPKSNGATHEAATETQASSPAAQLPAPKTNGLNMINFSTWTEPQANGPTAEIAPEPQGAAPTAEPEVTEPDAPKAIDFPTGSTPEANGATHEVAPETEGDPAAVSHVTEPEADDEVVGEPSDIPAFEVDLDPSLTDDAFADAAPIPPPDDPQAAPRHDSSVPVDGRSLDRKSTSHRTAFLSFAALVALVWLFAGRRFRRPV